MSFIASLPQLPYKWIGVALGALLIVSAVFFSIRAYGNAKFEAGEVKADAAWAAAAEELEKKSKESAAAADVSASKRAEDYAERLKEEKEKIDEAAKNDGDVFDVMFDNIGMPTKARID